MAHNDMVVIEVRIYQETDKAYQVGEPGLQYTDTQLMEWLPIALVNHRKDLPGNKTELEVPSWLVDKKDLENYVKT